MGWVWGWVGDGQEMGMDGNEGFRGGGLMDMTG